MRWTIQEDKKLKKLYLQTNLSFEKIEKIIGRSVPSLSNRITKLKIKRRFPAKFKCPSEITAGLARIHAHLCGDGNLYCSKQKDCYGPWTRYRKNPYRIKHYLVYNNNNQGLLNEFWQDIFSTFGIRGKKSEKNRIRVTSKKAYELLKNFGAGGSYI